MTTILRNFFKDIYEFTVPWKQPMHWSEGSNLQALSHKLFSHKSKPVPYSLNPPPLSLELHQVSLIWSVSRGDGLSINITSHYRLVRGSLVYNNARKAWLQEQRAVRQAVGQNSSTHWVSQQSWLIIGNWGKWKCLSPTWESSRCLGKNSDVLLC